MTLRWMKEDTPHWDADKQRLFGPDELAAAGFHQPAPGAAIADEWWRVTGRVGEVTFASAGMLEGCAGWRGSGQ